MAYAMEDKHILAEQELRDIYYDPNEGYQSADRLYRKANARGLTVTHKQVKHWLETQETYTVHKPVIKRHRFRATYVRQLGEQIQMDLVDMKKYKSENGGFYWILTAVEILSRYAFTIPVHRKDTRSMTTAVFTLLDRFRKRFGRYPTSAQFDDGSEFHNVGVKTYLSGLKIKYFSTFSERKATIVERFNRTLKTAMWKYFTAKGTHKWRDVLDILTDGYNNSVHRTIRMKPADVNDTCTDSPPVPCPSQSTGCPTPSGSAGIKTSSPREDGSGEAILGKFYEQELSRARGV